MLKIWKFRTLIFLLTISALTSWQTFAFSQEIQPKSVKMVMADGVLLAADLYLPRGKGQFPTILVRTPYGKSGYAYFGKNWAKAGFAAVIQDVRGKFDSQGTAEPLVAERLDSRASLDWLAKQSWCNGDIGMWGTSYLAYCALVAAAEGHPHLKTIFINSGYLHAEGLGTIGGTNHLLLNIPWLWHTAAQRNQSVSDVEFEDLFVYTPQKDVFKAHGLRSPIWEEPQHFLTMNKDLSSARINIPIFHMTGWFDFVKDASLQIYQKAAEKNPTSQKLMIGSWFHDQFYSDYSEVGDEDFGPQSVMGHQKALDLATRWFEKHLMGNEQGMADEPDVRFFLMGENRWVESDRWPPQGWQPQTWYLSSAKGANSLQGDGQLSRQIASEEGMDRFVYDPMNPVPTHGGANFHFFLPLLGVRDQHEIEKRPDVLVYTSEPLAGKQYLAGPIRVNLFVATEGKGTDFTAKLVIVRPDGYAGIVEESIHRLGARFESNTRVIPHKVYSVQMALGHTALTIPKGHRLRLEISSSNFPKYDRNPNTGEDPFLATTFRAVENRVLFGPKHPSALIVPWWTPKEP